MPVTFGCSASKWPSSWAWEVKSSPQSSQGKVLSDCLKCSVVTWCCSAPGKRKVAAQYRHLNGCDPGGGETEGIGRGGMTERSKSREGDQEGATRTRAQRPKGRSSFWGTRAPQSHGFRSTGFRLHLPLLKPVIHSTVDKDADDAAFSSILRSTF